jgi:predicted Zn-dependent protease
MNRPDRQQRIARFRDRLTADPEAKVFAPLADLLRGEGRIEEALVILEEGLTVHPGYISGRVVLGRTLLESGQAARAREVLLGVLKSDAENLVVLRLLVEEATVRGAWSEARPHLEYLSALDPERWAKALSDLPADTPVPGYFPPAREPDPEVGAVDPVDPSFATMTLVDIYLAQGYRDKARAALERIQAREPDREDVAERLAQLGPESGPLAGSMFPGALGALPQEDKDLLPAEQRARKTVRRTQDKLKFQDWLSKLREDERPTP